MLKYVFIPFLLFCCSQIAAQSENRGTIIAKKNNKDNSYNSPFIINPAYIDSHGVLQLIAINNNNLLYEEIRKANMLHIYKRESDTQIPLQVTSFTITIAIKRKNLKEFKVKGNAFKGRVLKLCSQLTPGDIIYIDDILIKNQTTKILGCLFKVVK